MPHILHIDPCLKWRFFSPGKMSISQQTFVSNPVPIWLWVFTTRIQAVSILCVAVTILLKNNLGGAGLKNQQINKTNQAWSLRAVNQCALQWDGTKQQRNHSRHILSSMKKKRPANWAKPFPGLTFLKLFSVVFLYKYLDSFCFYEWGRLECISQRSFGSFTFPGLNPACVSCVF